MWTLLVGFIMIKIVILCLQFDFPNQTHLKCHRGSEMSLFNTKRKWALRGHQRYTAVAECCPPEYVTLNYRTSLWHFKIECPVSRDVNKGNMLKSRLLSRSWASLKWDDILSSPLGGINAINCSSIWLCMVVVTMLHLQVALQRLLILDNRALTLHYSPMKNKSWSRGHKWKENWGGGGI